MTVRLSLPLLVLALVLLPLSVLAAVDLPPWTDDSGVAINAFPRHFSPLQKSVNLVGSVYHALDVPARVEWTISVRDSDCRVVREFSGSRTYEPGEPIQFVEVWNGRDDAGSIVADALYAVDLDVTLRPDERERLRAPVHADVHDDGHGELPRVPLIRQRFTQFVRVEAFPSSWSPEVSAQTPHDPGVPFNFYFGTLHTQTAFSDGGHPNDSTCASSTTHAGSDFTPAQAYDYARNTARLDFLGISDHNHQFENACAGCAAPQVIQRYKTGLAAAASATVDGSFVGIYGMEWGYIGNDSFPNEGHVNLYETPKLFGWEPTGCTVGSTCYYEVYTDQAGAQYPAMYTRAMANPSQWGAFGQFNHPSNVAGVDYNNFQYTNDGDDLIHTIAVISGPATDFSTAGVDTGNRYAGENTSLWSPYNTIDMYNRALGAGFHVAPVADSDVHCSNYGTSTRDRTVIMSASLTKAALFDAMHNRRMYATSDTNTQLVYTMIAGGTTYYMGAGSIRTSGPVATSGAITLHTSVWDPDATAVTAIKIKEPVPGNTNGTATTIATGTSSPFDYTFTPTAGNHRYYVWVTLANGNELFSAPIFINHSAVADTTPPTTSITAPANGATVSGTTLVTASASDNVGVARVEFYLDSVLQSTDTTSPYQWSWDTITAVNGSHTLTSRAFDAANNNATSAPVSVTVNNVADYSLSVTPASVTVTAGASASYTVNIARSGGFAGAVTLAISGLPAGASGTFNPNPASGTSSALSITTSATTPAGSYVFTVTGTSGTLTRTATATLVVQAPGAGDFTLSASPATRSIARNASTTYAITITRTGGFSAGVTLSVTNLPTGATGTFAPNPATATSSTLTVTTVGSTPAGTRTLTITGTAGGLTRTTTVTLTVTNSCSGNC